MEVCYKGQSRPFLMTFTVRSWWFEVTLLICRQWSLQVTLETVRWFCQGEGNVFWCRKTCCQEKIAVNWWSSVSEMDEATIQHCPLHHSTQTTNSFSLLTPSASTQSVQGKLMFRPLGCPSSLCTIRGFLCSSARPWSSWQSYRGK